MKFLAPSQLFGAGIQSLALAALAPVLLGSLPPASALSLSVPRNINASLVPPACTSTCQPALSAQTTCAGDLKCLCTNANADSFAGCMDCVVSTAPSSLAISAGQGVLSDYTDKCVQGNIPVSSLSLSLSPTASAAAHVADSNAATLNVVRYGVVAVVTAVASATSLLL